MLADRLRLPLAKAVAAIVIFGTAPASIRAVSHDAESLNAVALGIIRLTAAAAAMSALLISRGELSASLVAAWPMRTWRAMSAIGTLFGLHWLTYFLSIHWSSAAIGAVGFTTYGVQLPLLGWLFGFGRPTGRTLVALAIALAGAACFVPRWTLEGDELPGLLLGLASGTTYAGLPLLHQRHADLSNSLRTWAQFIFALPMFLLLAPLARWRYEAADLPWLINLAVVITLVGHYLWVQATTELPVQVTAVCAYLQLPASMLLAWLLIGEQMTPAMLVGAGLVVAGNALALSGRRGI